MHNSYTGYLLCLDRENIITLYFLADSLMNFSRIPKGAVKKTFLAHMSQANVFKNIYFYT